MPALPSSQSSPDKKEPFLETLLRKSRQQPFVPLGVALTCGALVLASRAIRARDSALANRMFYWRVGFQGFTVAALLGGAYYYDEGRKKEKSRDEKLREIAKMREKLWIEELERIEESRKQGPRAATATDTLSPASSPDSSSAPGASTGAK